MTTATLVTSVFLSKAEALAVLEEALEVPWNTDDPSDVTLTWTTAWCSVSRFPNLVRTYPSPWICTIQMMRFFAR